MFCKRCGYEVKEDFIYCPNCGECLSPTQDQHRKKDNSEEQFYKQDWFILLMFFLCYPVGIVLMFKYGGKISKIIGAIFLLLIIGAFVNALYITTFK